MITDLLSTDQLKAIKDSRSNLDKVLSENKYDGNKIDQEAYSLLESDKQKYFSQANEIFRNREGYEPGKEEAFMDAFELAQNDVLKKYPDVKKKDALISKAVDKHMNVLDEIISNSLIGEFGDMRINPKDPISHPVRYAIQSIVYDLDSNPVLVEKILKSR